MVKKNKLGHYWCFLPHFLEKMSLPNIHFLEAEAKHSGYLLCYPPLSHIGKHFLKSLWCKSDSYQGMPSGIP